MAIASLLDQDTTVDKFKTIFATTSMDTIAATLAQALEDILKDKPMIDVLTTPSGKVAFRADHNYYYVVDNKREEFNPFAADRPPAGDVMCDEKHSVFTQRSLERMWGSLDLDFIPSPVLQHIVADMLTENLNTEQEWVKRHRKNSASFLQEYISIEKLLTMSPPGMIDSEVVRDYQLARMDIQDDFNAFVRMTSLNRPGVTHEEALVAYKANGNAYEKRIMGDFWSRHEIQSVLERVATLLGKLVLHLFPAIRCLAERSCHPAHGYDVFIATVDTLSGQLVVKNLGDYRILYWELTHADSSASVS